MKESMKEYLVDSKDLKKDFEKLVATIGGKEYVVATNAHGKEENDSDYEIGELHFLGCISLVQEVGHCKAPDCKEMHPLRVDNLVLGSGRESIQVKTLANTIKAFALSVDAPVLSLIHDLINIRHRDGLLTDEDFKDEFSRIARKAMKREAATTEETLN